MHVAARPHVTAGIALAGAAVMAVSPIGPPLPAIHLPNQHDLQAAAVRLTAGWNPLAAWQNAFNTESTNASTLTDNFLLAPGVGLQQAIVNEVGFLKEVINDPSSLGTVLQQIATNARASRHLGHGYANLASYLMAHGLPYDSDAARLIAAGVARKPADDEVVEDLDEAVDRGQAGGLVVAVQVGQDPSEGVLLVRQRLGERARERGQLFQHLPRQVAEPAGAARTVANVAANPVGQGLGFRDLRGLVARDLVGDDGYTFVIYTQLLHA